MSSSGIVLIGPTTYGDFDPAPLQRLTGAGYEVRRNPTGKKLNEEELIQALKGVVGIIAGLEPISRHVLENSLLKVVSRSGVGLDNVDLAAARELGIKVFNTPDAPTVAVAEVAVGGIITLLRRVSEMDRQMHQGVWKKLSGPELAGKTLTLIGLGRIGLKVASYLKAFGVRLLAVDPARTGKLDDIPIVSLEEALPQSDIVSIHASGGVEIIGSPQFAQMKRGVYLVNTGRGGLINETALCAALEQKIVAGAWLDTFAAEPYEGPLRQFSQVLLTPHIGYSSDETRRRMEMEAAENLLKGLAEP